MSIVLLAVDVNAQAPRNDPNFRERAPPPVFPNTTIPPKYPEAKPQTHGLDLGRRDLETAKAYFKWLCDNEAGEFIYRTAEEVEGVFEMRRRESFAEDWRNYDRYYVEDPWGWTPGNGRERVITPYNSVMPRTYGGVLANDPGRWLQKGDYFRYFPENGFPMLEQVASPLDRKRYGDAPYIRYERVWPSHPEYDRDEKGNIRLFQAREFLNGPDLNRRKQLSLEGLAWYSPDRKTYDEAMLGLGYIVPQVESVDKIKSRYGFMWRGIERTTHDRELGIGGGEVLVFDLQTNEVLAVRRNFLYSPPYKGTRNVNWFTGMQCVDFGYSSLVDKVLKPIDPYKGKH